MYIFKNQLTNQNQDIQDKARYFADSFEFTLKHMGKYGFSSLENQRSLCEKILFQFINYDPAYSNSRIHHYAINPLLNPKDLIMKSYYSSFHNFIVKLRGGKYKVYDERQALIQELHLLNSELQSSLLKNAMKEIQMILHCPQGLSSHDHVATIDYATAIIISEFIFTGFQLKDIRQLFGKILSRDIKLNKGRVNIDFPLPKELHETEFSKKTAKSYHKVLTTFMEKRTLREQFEGISNFYNNNSSENKVLFKVLNLQSKRKISKAYGNVKLTTSCKSYLRSKSHEIVRQFVEDEKLYFDLMFHQSQSG